MKPSEIVKIDEGVGDWFARKGFLGREKQHAAIGKQMAADRDMASNQARDLLRNEFIKNLKIAIDGAMNSGIIKTAVPESEIYESYNSFNSLIENKILTEAMTVQQFVKKYMNDLLVNFGPIKAPYSTQVNKLAKDLANVYATSGNNFPNDVAGKLYDLALQIKHANPKTNADPYAAKPPSANIDISSPLVTRNFNYTFDSAKQEWSQWDKTRRGAPAPTAPRAVFTKSNQEWAQLNKLYASGSSL